MPGTLHGSSIREFYNDANIFITGGTGFLGKTLAEKFLRVCTNVNHIYLLIRVKKGKDPQMRLKELLKDPLFDVLRKERPDFEQKITCISGDVGYKRLGMSDNDFDFLTKEVTHVIHSAATVRFNEHLSNAIRINVQGTAEMANFCNHCDRLKIFVHVSTAYSNCHVDFIKEEFYESPMDGERVITFSETLKEEKMGAITSELIKPWPNTYSYTKAIAEDIVRKMSKRIPAVIFRPGIVMGTYREPVDGWIDNIYGPTGVIAGVGAGLMRVLPVNGNLEANIVPVDLTINALLACAWEVGTSFSNKAITEDSLDEPKESVESTQSSSEPKIFNFVADPNNNITWYDFLSINMKHGLKRPSQKSIWYYSITFTTYGFRYYFLVFFLHYIPAVLVDGICRLIGKKPMMLAAYNKIHSFTRVVTVFTGKQWRFTDDNVRMLWSNLSDADKEIFPFNMSQLSWDNYFESIIIGARRYIFKEKDDTIPAARVKMFFLWIAHRLLQVTFFAFWLWVLNKLFFKF